MKASCFSCSPMWLDSIKFCSTFILLSSSSSLLFNFAFLSAANWNDCSRTFYFTISAVNFLDCSSNLVHIVERPIFLTSKKYRMTNQKPDTIFFTSEKIRIGFSRLSGRSCEVIESECLQRSLLYQGLQTLIQWNSSRYEFSGHSRNWLIKSRKRYKRLEVLESDSELKPCVGLKANVSQYFQKLFNCQTWA